MAIKSPGDFLPCSIPEANAEKLRAIGVKRADPDATNVGPSGDPKQPGRTLPVAADPATGGRVDLQV